MSILLSYNCNTVDFTYAKLLLVKYLRNRKRVACVYSVIMHAGNVRRIREKRVILLICQD